MKRSDSIGALAKALVSFQASVKQPKKTATNPHFRNSYVPLDNVVDSIHETAPLHGLAYVQETLVDNERAGVLTMIVHESGEWMEFDPFLLPIGQKATPQAVGSAITYARRYSLSTAFGLASETDDDANSASDNAQQNPSKQQPRKQAPPNEPKATQTQIDVLKGKAVAIANAAGVDVKVVVDSFKIPLVKTVTDFDTVNDKMEAKIEELATKQKEAAQDESA